jgi:glucan-binding YG repeat protein
MKKFAVFFSLIAVFLAMVITPQTTEARSLYGVTATISGEEYVVTNDEDHFTFNVDDFVKIEGISEKDKLEKISISTPKGVETLSFNFGDNPLIAWDQELTVTNQKADYVLSNILGDLDKGKDGVAIQNLRQLLYPVNNHISANITAAYSNGSSDVLRLTIEQDAAYVLPESDTVSLEGASLLTADGAIEAEGSNNNFTLNLTGINGDTAVTGLTLFSEEAAAVSAFSLDSYLYRDATNMKFVDKKAQLDLTKIDFTNIPEDLIPEGNLISLTTIQEMRELITQFGTNTFIGVVADMEGNQSTFTIQVEIEGWKKIENKWYYFNYDGSTVSGWLYDNHWFYFDKYGVMQTGWIYDKGWYYLNQNGQMHTGWIYDSGWYFLNDKGLMKTGWIFDNGWYLLNSKGLLQTGWVKESGQWYLFNKSGLMQTGWVKDSGKWYYLDNSGTMETGWEKISGQWYYFNKSGQMQTGWEKISGQWYFMNISGQMQTGWEKISGQWYFMNASGQMQTGWERISGQWYFMSASGQMQTGWEKVSNQWYYLNKSGVMQTGWVKVSNKWYFMYNSGKMASNTTINGYKLGSNGAWIQ